MTLPRAERLMKLTFQSDAGSLESLLGSATVAPAPAPAAPAMETRTGFGFDVHAFGEAGEDGELVLAGVTFPGERPLKGHSDADVALHALTDAIYGGLRDALAATGRVGVVQADEFGYASEAFRGDPRVFVIEGPVDHGPIMRRCACVVHHGGAGTVAGPVLGAVVVGVLPELLSSLENLRLLFFANAVGSLAQKMTTITLKEGQPPKTGSEWSPDSWPINAVKKIME